MKKGIKIIISMLLVVGLVTGCGCKKKEKSEEEKIKTNEKEEFKKAQNINGIEISNINLTYENNMSTFTATVTNKTKVVKRVGIIDIIIKDKENKEVVTLKGMIDRNLNVNESASINASTNIDLTSYEKIEFKVN